MFLNFPSPSPVKKNKNNQIAQLLPQRFKATDAFCINKNWKFGYDLWHWSETIPLRAISRILGKKREHFSTGQSLIRKDLFACLHVSAFLWVHTGSVQNEKKVLKVYFSSILCEVSRTVDKEQIWMGKKQMCVLLQPMAQRVHSGLLPCLFCPLLSHGRLQVRVLKTIWENKRINDRACPVLWLHAP